ncbi:16008_t:CDS:10, partial [Acaulospora morrowiae]
LDINPEIQMSTKQFLEMDSIIASYEIMSDMEIVKEVLHCSNPLPLENNSEDEVILLPKTVLQGKEMLEGALLCNLVAIASVLISQLWQQYQFHSAPYRQKHGPIFSFRREADELKRSLNLLVKDNSEKVREGATRLLDNFETDMEALLKSQEGVHTSVSTAGGSTCFMGNPTRSGDQPVLWREVYILTQLRRGNQLALWGTVRHRTKFEDVHIFWQRIENETLIDNAETEVACKFIYRSSNVIDVALTNVEEKMKQNRKHAENRMQRQPYENSSTSLDEGGGCSTKKIGGITPVCYNNNLSEIDSEHEEKANSILMQMLESDKRKQYEYDDGSDYEPSSSPSSDSSHYKKKKQKISKRKQSKSKVTVICERNHCSSTNKNEDNSAPAIIMTGGDVASPLPLSLLLPPSLLSPPSSLNSVLNNVIIPQDLPTLVNQDQLSTLTANPSIQTPGTPPPMPNVNNIQITPQKSVLSKESVTYLQNYIELNVNGQGMIIKDNHTSEETSSIIRNWLITALTSPKEEFVKAIIAPLSSEASPKDHDFRQICEFVLYDFYFMTKKGPLRRDVSENTYIVDRIAPLFKAIQSVYNEYKFHWIEVELDCMREVKKIFPKFDLPINQADDSEKLLKEAVFGLVSLLRNYLDKSAEESKQLYTFIIQGIGDRLTLSKLCLINKHVYKVSQIKSATLPFEFIDVADYLAVFEFLYILVIELESQTRVINKLRLSRSADGVIVPRIRDWIWIPDSISAWECEEIQNENL